MRGCAPVWLGWVPKVGRTCRAWRRPVRGFARGWLGLVASGVRGEFGMPKSRRSIRSVPMADEVGAELSGCSSAPTTSTTATRIRSPGDRQATAQAGSCAACAARSRLPGSTRPIASTTCAIRSERAWPRRACRCGRCRVARPLLGDDPQIYADYSPSSPEADMIAAVFARGSIPGSNLSESESISENSNRIDMRETPDESRQSGSNPGTPILMAETHAGDRPGGA